MLANWRHSLMGGRAGRRASIALLLVLAVCASVTDASVGAPRSPATCKPRQKACKPAQKSDRVPPRAVSVTVSGATVIVSYAEPVRAGAGSYSVQVDGNAARVTSTRVSGRTVRVTLATPAWGDNRVTVTDYGGAKDLAGNRSTGPYGRVAVNRSPAGFAPSLSVPPFVNDRTGASSPQVGEWSKAGETGYFLDPRKLHAVMLFVDWPDYPATEAPDVLANEYIPPAETWFRDVSYGRFDYSITPVLHWYRMPELSSQAGLNNTDCCGRYAVRDAMSIAAHLADADVDFSQYDAIYVVGAVSPNVSIVLDRTWPGEGFTIDGKEFDHGVFGSGYDRHGRVEIDPQGQRFDATRDAHNIVTHETGHLLGLPDLYETASATSPHGFSDVGGWDIMEQTVPAAHYFAWEKYLLGWIDPSQIRGLPAPGTLQATITPLETAGGMKAIMVPTSPSTLDVVEVRQPIGKDAGICDHGVLLYSVDSSVRNAQGAIHVLPAQVGSDHDKILSCGAHYEAPFDLGAGEVSTYDDAKIHVEVVSTDGTNYTVRVTRKP